MKTLQRTYSVAVAGFVAVAACSDSSAPVERSRGEAGTLQPDAVIAQTQGASATDSVVNGAVAGDRSVMLSQQLGTAAMDGNAPEVRRLIEAGAVVNAKDEFHATPLMYAVSHGHVEATKLLIEAGADVNATGNMLGTVVTPLMVAVPVGSSFEGDHADHAEVVTLLIEAGADVNAVGSGLLGMRITPLGHAVMGGHTRIVRLLIEAGVDVNSGDGVELTPLSAAVRSGHTEIAELLREAGGR